MCDSNKTGGPAFPVSVETEWGMTLRDYFAAHAPQDDVERFYEEVKPREHIDVEPNGYRRINWRKPDNARQIARYMYADAMLKARNDK